MTSSRFRQKARHGYGASRVFSGNVLPETQMRGKERMDAQLPEPVLNVVGEKVALGPLRRDLLPLLQRWINDFEVTRTLAARLVPTTLEQEEAWYEGAGKSETDVR